jgi:hypothetical protein
MGYACSALQEIRTSDRRMTLGQAPSVVKVVLELT